MFVTKVKENHIFVNMHTCHSCWKTLLLLRSQHHPKTCYRWHNGMSISKSKYFTSNYSLCTFYIYKHFFACLFRHQSKMEYKRDRCQKKITTSTLHKYRNILLPQADDKRMAKLSLPSSSAPSTSCWPLKFWQAQDEPTVTSSIYAVAFWRSCEGSPINTQFRNSRKWLKH